MVSRATCLSVVLLIIAGASGMDFTIQSASGFKLVGLQKKILSVETASEEIGKLYDAFFNAEYYDQIQHKLSDQIVAVYTRYAFDPFSYTFFLGIPVCSTSEQPEELSLLEIPSQSYAVYSLKDPSVASVGAFWADIWSLELPYTRTFTADFEVYPGQISPRSQQEFYDVYAGASAPEVKIYIAKK